MMNVYTHPDYSYVNVVEVPIRDIAFIDIDICDQPRETLGHYYNRMKIKPALLINAGFFNTKTFEACFSMIDDEQLIVDHYKTREGLGTIRDETYKLVFGKIDDGTEWNDFIAGYPVLVNNGSVLSSVSTMASEINYKAARSAVGYDDENIYFVTVSTPGLKLESLAKLMYKLGCNYAINLDGGGSSRMLVNGETVNKPSENRAVDSVLAVYMKYEEDKPESTEEFPYITHTVIKGDSMWKISKYYLDNGNRYREIMDFNNLTTAVLMVGQILKIPVDCEKYTVVSGDTLWKIATDKLGSGLRFKEIADFNNIDPKQVLSVGQIIYIPV